MPAAAPPPSISSADPAAPATADPVQRLLALADQCVLCGLCLPHCPTYAADRIEAESPRGRIMQFRALATGQLRATPAATTHLDHCLGCRNCEPVCPARVRYSEILDRGRALLRQQRPPQWRQRMLEWVVARPRALSVAVRAARVLRRLLPRRLRALADQLQAPRAWPKHYPAATASRGKVGLLLGCVTRHVQPGAVDAAVLVLTRLGWDVHVPAGQTCCGALARHAGNPAAADQLAAVNAQAFAAAGVQTILVIDSGCVGALQAGSVANAPALRVLELLAFVTRELAGQGIVLDAAPAGPPLALHLPCTQRNVTGSATAAGAALDALCGGATRVGAQGCCGAAGNQLLFDAGRAAHFRAPLLDAIQASGAATLASGNVGCRMHLDAGLRASHGTASVRVVHPIELIAEHLAGRAPAARDP